LKNFSAIKAAYIFLTLNSLLIIFHVLVLSSIIPYEYVWGGGLDSQIEMYIKVSTALIVSLLFLVIVVARIRQIQQNRSHKLLTIAMWIMFALFALNTVSNLYAEELMETLIFTPSALVLALLSLRMALWKSTPEKK